MGAQTPGSLFFKQQDDIPTTLCIVGLRDAIAALDTCLETITGCALIDTQYEYLERAITKARTRLMDELYANERRLLASTPPADA